MAIKQRRLAARVVGVGRKGSPSVGVALKRGAIDEGAENLREASGGADLVVLCTPVGQFREALELLRSGGDGILVTDVGSTKGAVMRWAREILGSGGPVFAGSHPMAGSEKRGPEHARADLFEGALCLVCGEPPDVEEGAVERVEGLWRAVGMRTLRVDAETHDRWVANVSHAPHAVAFALMNAAAREPASLAAAAGGFGDMTRIAGSDVEMWTDIFLTNGERVKAALEAFGKELGSLQAAIAAGDGERIRELLTRARAEREALVRLQTARGSAGGEQRT
jgi:prephenate dehydrogenase